MLKPIDQKQAELKERMNQERLAQIRVMRKAKAVTGFADEFAMLRRRLKAIEKKLGMYQSTAAVQDKNKVAPDCPITIAAYESYSAPLVDNGLPYRTPVKPVKPAGYTRLRRRESSKDPVWIAYCDAYDRYEAASMEAYAKYRDGQ